MENPRTESARAHDDSELIEGAESAPGQAGTSGGNIARDVASRDELAQVGDPAAHTRATKEIDQDNDQARRNNRPRD